MKLRGLRAPACKQWAVSMLLRQAALQKISCACRAAPQQGMTQGVGNEPNIPLKKSTRDGLFIGHCLVPCGDSHVFHCRSI